MNLYIRRLLNLSLTESLLLSRVMKIKISIDEDEFKNQVITIICDNREVTIMKISPRIHDGITFLVIEGDVTDAMRRAMNMIGTTKL